MAMIQEMLERYPRLMGMTMGIVLHPLLSIIVFGR